MTLEVNPVEKTIKILNQDKILFHDLIEALDEVFKNEYWRNYTLILKESESPAFIDYYAGKPISKSFMPLEFDAYKPTNKEAPEKPSQTESEDSNTG